MRPRVPNISPGEGRFTQSQRIFLPYGNFAVGKISNFAFPLSSDLVHLHSASETGEPRQAILYMADSRGAVCEWWQRAAKVCTPGRRQRLVENQNFDKR